MSAKCICGREGEPGGRDGLVSVLVSGDREGLMSNVQSAHVKKA
jgi:hypothetical protein